MRYELKQPCSLCPFRNDEGQLYVAPSTLEGMASGEFCCHKTGECNDETGNVGPTEKSQHCAGALIFNEHRGRPHQMMRICERLGLYDRQKLDMSAPVFRSMSEVREKAKGHKWQPGI